MKIQESIIQTTSSVNIVRWRPNRPWQLASSSLITDCNVHVWDVRRPFIPFASFEHKDVVTGICWLNDPHTFLSCGKDMLLKQNFFKDASRPANYASPISLNLSPQGDLAWTIPKNPDLNEKSKGGPQKSTSLVGYLQALTPNKIHDEFVALQNRECHLNMFMISDNEPAFSQDWFVASAKEYKICGLPFSQMCQRNAEVATRLRRPQIAATWKMLITLYDFSPEPHRQPGADAHNKNEERVAGKIVKERVASESVGGVSFGLDTGITETETEDDTTGEGMESGISAVPLTPGTAVAPLGNALRTVHSDFFFGSAEHNSKDLVDFENFMDDHTDAWLVRREAFEPKMDLLSAGFTNGFPSPSATENGHNSMMEDEPEVVVRPPSALSVTLVEKRPLLDPSKIVSEMLEYFAETGDVQMTVSVLLVLGEKGTNLIDPALQEHWYLAYLDLLDQFELWTVSALVIKMCPLSAVSSLSQESATVIIGCGRCEKVSGKHGWICDSQNPVRSLWSWCEICGHGGHMTHLQNWFSKYQLCPAGCGHRCEYEQFLRT